MFGQQEIAIITNSYFFNNLNAALTPIKKEEKDEVEAIHLMPLNPEDRLPEIVVRKSEDEDMVKISLDDINNSEKPLYLQILEGDKTPEYLIEKEILEKLSEKDNDAIFKIAELIDKFIGVIKNANRIINVVNVLSDHEDSLELVFINLLYLTVEEAKDLFQEEDCIYEKYLSIINEEKDED